MSTNILTYDDSPPFRPSIRELGGGAKVNGASLPEPVRMMTAEDANQWAKQIEALARVAGNAIVTVRETAGTYTIHQVGALGSSITTGSGLPFSITKNGTGDVTIWWAAGTFPAPIADHEARATGATFALAMTDSTTINQARVRLFDAAGAAVEAPFNLSVF